jgi:plastocyanin
LLRLTASFAVCAIVASGCGGDDDEPGRTLTVPANGKVRVVGKEYSFDPERIVVRGAGTLTLTLANRGSLAHNLRLVRGEERAGGVPTFPAGGERTARVNLEHGNYEMVCTVGDHAELGMKGTLEVR